MERILIIGSSGSGKSTLAGELGRVLGIPVLHLDAMFWTPGWVQTSGDEMRAAVTRALAGERWIIDGNYSSSLPQRVAAADTVILLDFPRLVCIWRIFKRLFRYHGRTRPDMRADCPERFDFVFLQWVWEFPDCVLPKVIEQLRQHAAGKRVIILRNAAEVREFVDGVRSQESVVISQWSVAKSEQLLTTDY